MDLVRPRFEYYTTAQAREKNTSNYWLWLLLKITIKTSETSQFEDGAKGFLLQAGTPNPDRINHRKLHTKKK